MYIDLSGEWSITLEAEEGMQSGTIMLPGILQACGYGNPVTRHTPWVSSLHDSFWYEQEEYKFGQENGVKVPFLAQPPRHFLGEAVYEREFVIPEPFGETGCPVIHFHIEAARWRSRVWIDGNFQGEDCSLCTPHDIRISGLEPGRHTIRVVLDNSMLYPYRPDAHSVSDALGGSWNGMLGEIALFTEDVYRERKRAREAYAGSHPRTVKVVENRILIDNRPIYFRATHFGGDFPLTGCPAMDKGWWRKKMSVVREWGLNGIRFHSWCPPEAAFAAADEEGIFLLVECGMWNHFGEDGSMYSLLKQEAERILENFGHHPSFVFFSPTNEPGGAWYKPLRQWVSEARKYDESLGYGGRRIYTAQSGWFYDVPPAEIEGTDFIYFHRSGYGPYIGGTIRNPAGWRGGNYSPSLEGVKKPVFCHELGQICAYPDYSVTDKFTGFLQPGNYEVFRENARANGILPYAEEFAKCSGENQVRLYKEELEANFRTPELQGFELLDLHDYLGQGTALVGILDPFWESKGYVCPEDFRKFCGDTVLLAGCGSYVWKRTDTAVIPVEVCHYGEEDIRGGVIRWELSCGRGQRMPQKPGTEALQDEKAAEEILQSGAVPAEEILRGGAVPAEEILQSGVVPAEEILQSGAVPAEEILRGGAVPAEEILQSGVVPAEEILQSGAVPVEEIKRGSNTKVGEITLCFEEILREDAFPENGLGCILKLDLWMDAPGIEGTIAHNSWAFHVFRRPDVSLCIEAVPGQGSRNPQHANARQGKEAGGGPETLDAGDLQGKEAGGGPQVLYTRDWAEAKRDLEAGGKVVFSPYLSDMNYECPALSGRSVNWNSQMGPSWCRTMGVVADENHPIFRFFPTGHSGGWQWEDILEHARGFHMEGLERIRPIVQPIDDWNRNLLQGMIFEARVLEGRLLLVSADLEGSFEERPAAFSLKEAILRYAASDLFNPAVDAEAEAIERKLFPVLRMEALTDKVLYGEGTADTAAPEERVMKISHGEAVVTADPNRSARVEKAEFPVYVTVVLKKPVEIRGIVYVPEQRDRQHEGFVKDYTVEVRNSATGSWENAAKGTFRNTCRSQSVFFDSRAEGDAVRLTVHSAYGCVDKYVWQETEKGWYRVFSPARAVVQIAGIHIMCDEASPHGDVFMAGNRKSRTKEIDP